MRPAKRIRVEPDQSETVSGSKDYSVCDPCRAKKIRCGRERPRCSNCMRLGQECSWSGQGKKPSQTTTLNHAMYKVNARLERLECGIDSIQRYLAILSQDKWSSNASTTLHSRPTSVSMINTGFSSLSPSMSSQSPARYPGFRHLVQIEGSNWKPYKGPTTLRSLILDVKEFILDQFGSSEGVDAQQGVTSARENLDTLLDAEAKHGRLYDESPLEVPPMAIVEAMSEPYFEYVSQSMPIWTRQGFQRIIEACQTSSEDGVGNRAYVVCANNLVILTLTAKSFRLNSRRRLQAPQYPFTKTQKSSSMELDFLKTFLGNAKRALCRIEQLLSPSLVNVQAFLSLCLVAQQYFTEDVSSLLFHQAAYIARSAGLNYSRFSTTVGDESLADVQERRNVLQCLCAIGSSVSWLSGTRSNFTAPESISAILASTDVSQSASNRPADTDCSFRSRLALARIEDELFMLAYSQRPDAQKLSETHYGLFVLRQQLQDWWSEFGAQEEIAGLGAAEWQNGSHGPGYRAWMERAISFHTLRVLMAWPVSNRYEDLYGALDDSRSCLRLFIRAFNMESDRGHYSSLIRLLTSYPPVAFIQVLAHVANNDGPKHSTSSTTSRCSSSGSSPSSYTDNDDVELLKAFAHAMQPVADLGNDPSSYTARLSTFVRTMTDFVAAFRLPGQEKPTSGLGHNGNKSLCSSIEVSPGHITAVTTPTANVGLCEKRDQEFDSDIFDMLQSNPPSSNPSYHFSLPNLNSRGFSEFIVDDEYGN